MKNKKENLREMQSMTKYKEALFPLPKYSHIVEKTFTDY